jgi:hypothetical protein
MTDDVTRHGGNEPSRRRARRRSSHAWRRLSRRVFDARFHLRTAPHRTPARATRLPSDRCLTARCRGRCSDGRDRVTPASRSPRRSSTARGEVGPTRIATGRPTLGAPSNARSVLPASKPGYALSLSEAISSSWKVARTNDSSSEPSRSNEGPVIQRRLITTIGPDLPLNRRRPQPPRRCGRPGHRQTRRSSPSRRLAAGQVRRCHGHRQQVRLGGIPRPARQ